MKLADGLTLPLDAATQVFAVMGRRGSGKTYGAGKLVELLLEAKRQVVVVDPVGVWPGLRFLADGKTPGFEIPILGGQHGDIPLQATAGKVVAELVATHDTSMVLDVSEFTGADQRRFVAEFAAELLHAKKRARSPLMVVFEEAQEFVPQHVRGETAKMVGAVEKLVKLGRNFGVGTALLSQRPQAVNKDVLNQAEVLLAFQLTGPQERKAIEGWVQEKGASGRGELAGELPGLPVGTAIVWSPQWLNVYGRFRILKKKTMDLSATPTGAAAAAKPLPPIDLGSLKTAMAATLEEVKASDPKVLREEIARLRRQLADADAVITAAAPPPPPPLPLDVMHEVSVRAMDLCRLLGVLGRALATPLPRWPGHQASQPSPPAPETAARQKAPPRAARALSDGPGKPLVRGEREILALLKACHPERLTRPRIAVMLALKPKGTTLRTYLGNLHTHRLTDETAGGIGLTAAGLQDAPARSRPTPRELLALWREKLTGKQKDILDLHAAEHGPLTKAEIADRLGGIDPNGTTLRTYLGALITEGVIRRTSHGTVVNPELAL